MSVRAAFEESALQNRPWLRVDLFKTRSDNISQVCVIGRIDGLQCLRKRGSLVL